MGLVATPIDTSSISELRESLEAVRSTARLKAVRDRVETEGSGTASAKQKKPRARNRNAERSIRLLEEAFVQLLAEKPYDKITVTDVTRQADLNRGTFYAHFSSIEDLMNQLMDSLADTLSALVEQVMDLSFVENPMPVLQLIGGFIEENLGLVQKLMESKSIATFTGPLKERIRGQIKEFLTKEYAENASAALMIADYISSGLFGVYTSWIKGDYQGVAIDEINDGLCELIHSASFALGDATDKDEEPAEA